MYAFRDLTSHPDIMPGRDLSHVSPQLLVPIAKVRQEEEAKGGAEEAKQKPKRGGGSCRGKRERHCRGQKGRSGEAKGGGGAIGPKGGGKEL